ncbi:hypothetical protein H4582DRAFT_702236 [Lactarius indigo]|nr:hypothetical protein H4582DRAFT_702236 [Lactarius indigo]
MALNCSARQPEAKEQQMALLLVQIYVAAFTTSKICHGWTDHDKRLRAPSPSHLSAPLHSHSYVQISDLRVARSNPKSQPGPGPGPRSNPQVSSPPGSTRSTSCPSSATAVQSSSLFDTLTKPAADGYPATNVIEYLVEIVGRDVVSFRRNAQVSYLLVDRARDICDVVNIYIRNTESGTDWSSFGRFSNAIDPVEELLCLSCLRSRKMKKTHHLIEGDSVHECITSVDSWVTNREEIWTTLNLLETPTELTDLFSGVNVSSRWDEREEARNHDKELLGIVIEDIDRAITSLAKAPHDVVHTMIENFEELFNKFPSGEIPPDLTMFILKAGLQW